MTAPEIPPWGTAPTAPAVTRFAVVGFFAASEQRVCVHVMAETPRLAEEQVQREYGGQVDEDGVPCDLKVCGVLAIRDDQIVAVDTYATFLDPAEPA